MLRHIFGKNKKKDIGTPKSISLSSSVSDSESSLQLDSLQVNTDVEGEPTTEAPPGDRTAEAVPPNEQPPATSPASPAEGGSPGPVDEQPTAGEAGDSELESTTTEAASTTAEGITETPAQRRSRATTIGTTPGPDDSYEYQEQKERQEAMIRIWRKATTPKKLPFPSKYPGYLKEPPELSYEDTSSSIRRKIYNDNRMKVLVEEPFKRDDSRVVHLSPKSNRAVDLRWKYVRKEPLVSQYFSEHYNAYKKPPFKKTNVKFHN